MSDYTMADIAGLLGTDNTYVAKNSTSRKGNTDLTMEDFLTLMVVQLQNQTIDDTMDTSEMMNQMVQMQMITAINNMNDTTIMTYASSLVGKTVTIGIVSGNTLEEREIEVIGTGMLNGQQVIFGDDGETYALSQIMAVGKLPEIEEPDKTESGENSGGPSAGSVNGIPNIGDPTDKSDETGDGDDEENVDGAVDGAGDVTGSENAAGNNIEYKGENGASADDTE